MQPNSFKVTGPRASLETLRKALLEEAPGPQIIVTDLAVEQGSTAPASPVRQEWFEVPVAFMIHFGATATYEWVREWLRKRKDKAEARVVEVPPPAKGSGEPAE